MSTRPQSESPSTSRRSLSSRISAVRDKFTASPSGAESEARARYYDPETESIASTRSSGRGGAGNIQPHSPPIADIPWPRGRDRAPAFNRIPPQNMRSTGRGGAGNIKSYPLEPTFAERSPSAPPAEIEVVRSGGQRSPSNVGIGRGGAGNIHNMAPLPRPTGHGYGLPSPPTS
ncbi:hypothetical protein R3P38DRAFT_3108891 [Favolaschia claudopus]|uniref:Uncharacterized protein n=1 Tax=Favolaschia claudopus TaxID=2862362 RepID=A0AAV9ZI72_9AGAR